MDNERYLIAILDEEQKERETFLNYFETSFDVLELEAVDDINQLIDIIRSEKLDAIAIDYKLMDHGSSFSYNGDYFFKELHETLTDYPAFIITNDPVQAKKESSKINPFYILDKGHMDLTNPQLKEDVTNIIRNYKGSIDEKLNELEKLNEIRLQKGLNSSQEDRFVELSSELDGTVDKQNHISRTFYSEGTNKKLDEIIARTEELLKKVSKK